MSEEGEWFSVKQAAEFLGVSTRTIFDYVQQGRLPSYKANVGGRRLFRRKDLEDFKRPRPTGQPTEAQESRRAA